jgi:hypothetical protein
MPSNESNLSGPLGEIEAFIDEHASL